MAETLCSLKKYGGGSLKETVLWTNASPTAAFNNQTVTLSEDMTHFDYIKIIFLQNSSDTPLKYLTVIHPVDEFANTGLSGSVISGGVGYNQSIAMWSRSYAHASDTSVQFSKLLRMSGTSAGSQNICIPQSISGLK